MNTKTKGDRTEGAVLAALLKAGRTVLIPFGENHRYDLVIEDSGSYYRVQCKTGRLERGGIEFNSCSVHAHRGKKSRGYKGEADIFGVFCPQNDKVYLVPVDSVGTSNVFLRIDSPKNGRKTGLRMASDYELSAV